MEKEIVFNKATQVVKEYMKELNDMCENYPFPIYGFNIDVCIRIETFEHLRGDFCYNPNEGASINVEHKSFRENHIRDSYGIIMPYDDINSKDKNMYYIILGVALFIIQNSDTIKEIISNKIKQINVLMQYESICLSPR